MLDLLERIADQTPETNPYIGDGGARRARAELAGLSTATPDATRWSLLMRVADEELRLGNEAEALAALTQARQMLSGSRETPDPLWLPATLLRVGVAHLRSGEDENCRFNPSANSCILPLQPDAIHRWQEGSQRAIGAFTQVLERTPPGSPLHLGARWLLNLAYMTVGEYPEAVPRAYLIPVETFQSDDAMPRFANIAPNLGLDISNMAGGAIVDDFDNDGYLDIVVSTWDTRGQLRLFKNGRDGTFVDRTSEAGLLGLYGGLNLVQADYDNDGWTDVLVLRGAWLGQNGRHPNSLLRNNGDSTFTDVTFEAGLGDVHYPTHSAAWADYDNDGDLDLYVGNESSDAIRAPGQLFRNNGDRTFTDVAARAGVENLRYAKGVVWGDYDGDRRPDLYISNFKQPNRLYRNNGDGTFTDVAEPLGVTGPMASFPAWFWDVDNDGWLDLYVAAYAAGIEDLAADAVGLPVVAERAKLYRGTGRGRFTDVAGQYGLTRPNAPMGANFGDVDNDGYLDFYLGTGYPEYHSLMPNVMYLNRHGAAFADVSYAGGVAHLQKGHGVAFADLDHDGDQDVFQQMGGAYPGDRARNVLYQNPGFGNHWLTVKLVGVRSNRSGIGARIRALVMENGQRREIHKQVNSGGTFGAQPLRQTIGLGRAMRIETLEVFWPTTGLTQSFHDVALDRAIQIVEGESSPATLALERLTLGGHGHGHVH
jgi:hypothetical protein